MVAKMDTEQLKKIIETNFKKIEEIDPQTRGELPDAINEVISLLDTGKIRVAEKKNSKWIVNQWIKQAILLSFKTNEMELLKGPYTTWWDKVPGKTVNWTKEDHKKADFRSVPNGTVRKGSYIGKNVILMPSFVNVGAYVDDNSMIDTWATVGSCAQVGKNVHLSGGAGLGGVLEPLQASPTIIEDNCFIGARSEVAEGVIIREGSVLSMGVFISASTKIVERDSGKIHMGEVPPYSVVVPGTLAGKNGGPSLACVVIVKQVDEKTRSKTSINDLLRD
jgi:2,3,4,5-tetrahydropyridine-2-carboxylate N-succinyltransferase